MEQSSNCGLRVFTWSLMNPSQAKHLDGPGFLQDVLQSEVVHWEGAIGQMYWRRMMVQAHFCSGITVRFANIDLHVAQCLGVAPKILSQLRTSHIPAFGRGIVRNRLRDSSKSITLLVTLRGRIADGLQNKGRPCSFRVRSPFLTIVRLRKYTRLSALYSFSDHNFLMAS